MAGADQTWDPMMFTSGNWKATTKMVVSKWYSNYKTYPVMTEAIRQPNTSQSLASPVLEKSQNLQTTPSPLQKRHDFPNHPARKRKQKDPFNPKHLSPSPHLASITCALRTFRNAKASSKGRDHRNSWPRPDAWCRSSPPSQSLRRGRFGVSGRVRLPGEFGGVERERVGELEERRRWSRAPERRPVGRGRCEASRSPSPARVSGCLRFGRMKLWFAMSPWGAIQTSNCIVVTA